MRIILLSFLLVFFVSAYGQDLVITGRVVNESSEGLNGVNIKLHNSNASTTSNSTGYYTLKISNRPLNLKLTYSLTGFVSQVVEFKTGADNSFKKDIVLAVDVTQLSNVTIHAGRKRLGNMQSIDQGLIQNIPSVSGNFESVLKTLPGVSANNELSSQYSVRGGNFDENLIYINDIEIFRPLLVRNGQQEGLSFINPELVSRANFSAGGFDARYGEKLSSVLDVKYSKPDSMQVIASAGLLGLSATAKIPHKNSYVLVGFRQKTNRSILKSQPTKGSYQPQFYDLQALYSIGLTKKLNLSTFADFNLNRFTLIPESRETIFGTINQQYRLKIDYEGREKDRYQSLAAALTLTYQARKNFWFKWLNSAFNNSELETRDIQGDYVFQEISSNIAGFDNVRINRGLGVNYEYARNKLNASIYSTELKAFHQGENNFFESGIRYQFDHIDDRLNEYQLRDSAGYILPNTTGELKLSDVVNTSNSVYTSRITAYIQNTISLNSEFTLSAGLRNNYNSNTGEFLISPRISLVYQPYGKDINYRIAAGSYNQPPFYRELRNFDGSLNHQAKSQRSIHLLAAYDRIFQRSGSPTKFSSEFYYKILSNLVPYTVENLRVRYFADQQSKGYAMGADFSVSKEFVSGLESSFRLSLMKTAENIEDDTDQQVDGNGNINFAPVGYLKRPTDQRVNFSAFFQDKLFNSPSYKVHLTLLYGSSLPVWPPGSVRYGSKFKIPSYKRVDIGFSKDLLEGTTQKRIRPLGRYLNSFIVYAEVFNLLNINNTVSFLWIKDVNNNQFAIPNYLTSRQLNIKFIAKLKN